MGLFIYLFVCLSVSLFLFFFICAESTQTIPPKDGVHVESQGGVVGVTVVVVVVGVGLWAGGRLAV